MEAVSMILALARKIAKAAETARQNKERCLDLADRARTAGDILLEDHDSSASMIDGSGDSAAGLIRNPALARLKAALDNALELVESQPQSGGLGWGVALLTSGTVAARFQLVEARISNCVGDLGLAELVAARHRAHDANTRATLSLLRRVLPKQSAPSPQPQAQGEVVKSLLTCQCKHPTPTPPQQGKIVESLLTRQHKHSAPTPPQQGEVVESLLTRQRKHSTPTPPQQGEVVESLLTRQHQHSAPTPPQQGKIMESLLARQHKHSAPTPPQQGKVVESLLTRQCKHSAPTPPRQGEVVESLLTRQRQHPTSTLPQQGEVVEALWTRLREQPAVESGVNS
ncbi:snake venom metalloprotease inhibitor 02A10 [Triticum aestivum]|uniref:Uncharacterized protein n=1 Tax=Triticum aestivum TaxID=4565 RepID=A0A3B6TDU3_WHEAT|nr:snake venom metalloprotease inhibitor 02A10-like [Triticum aestivum]